MINRILICAIGISFPFLAQAQTTAGALRSQVPLALEPMVRNAGAYMGFAANDARIGATQVAAASRWATTRTALAAATPALSNIPWVRIGLLAYGVYEIAGKLLTDNGDGTVTVPGAAPSAEYSQGTFAILSSQGFPSVKGSVASVLAWYNANVMPVYYPPAQWGVVTRNLGGCSTPTSYSGGTFSNCDIQYQSGEYISSYVGITSNQIPPSQVCNGGVYNPSTSSCAGGTPSGPTTKTWDEFINGLTPAELNTPVSPELFAKVANGLLTGPWLYEVPGTLNLGPFTPAQAAAALATNPVTLAGLLQTPLTPANPNTTVSPTDPSTWNVPVATNPTTGTPVPLPLPTPVPGTPPVNSAQLNPVQTNGTPITNLGPDPGITAPTDTTVPSIWTSISSQFDPYRVTMSAFGGTCPSFNITILGGDKPTTGMCALLETIHPTIFTVFTLIWTFSAFSILLRRT